MYRRQGSRPSPRNKSKLAVTGGLINSCEKKRSENKGEKERYTHLNAEFQRIARRDKKASSALNAKKQRKTTEWERLGIYSTKMEIAQEHFTQEQAQ